MDGSPGSWPEVAAKTTGSTGHVAMVTHEGQGYRLNMGMGAAPVMSAPHVPAATTLPLTPWDCAAFLPNMVHGVATPGHAPAGPLSIPQAQLIGHDRHGHGIAPMALQFNDAHPGHAVPPMAPLACQDLPGHMHSPQGPLSGREKLQRLMGPKPGMPMAVVAGRTGGAVGDLGRPLMAENVEGAAAFEDVAVAEVGHAALEGEAEPAAALEGEAGQAEAEEGEAVQAEAEEVADADAVPEE